MQCLELWEIFSLFPACAALTVIQKETSSSEEGIVIGGCVIFSVSSEEMPVHGTTGASWGSDSGRAVRYAHRPPSNATLYTLLTTLLAPGQNA